MTVHATGCDYNDCGRPVFAKGLCSAHYTRSRRGQDMDAPILKPPPTVSPCSVDGCDTPAKVKGLCNTHSNRHYHNKPLDEPIQHKGQYNECIVDGCHRDPKAHGYCSTHYSRAKKNLPLDVPIGALTPPVYDGDLRKCALCQQWLPLERFSANGRRGRHAYCKECDGVRQVMRKYNVNETDARALREATECDICGSTDPGASTFHVDHDHTTGDVRGVLCWPCNRELGFYEATRHRAEQFEQYLNR